MSPPDHLVVPIGARESEGSSASSKSPQSSDDKILKYLAEKVAQHECILFLGSAVHAPSPENSKYVYTKNECPPIGSELSKHLASKCGFPGEDWWNLQRVSQYYESTFKSRFMLVEDIKNAVYKDKTVSPVLRGLASLGFPIVITTNYDDLYERALSGEVLKEAQSTATPAQYDVSIYSPNNNSQLKTDDCRSTPSKDRPYILKIHGDISRPESIVITDEDYIQFVLRMSDKHPFHPVGKNISTYLNKWITLFIGYRLTDYNLRLLFKTLRWKMDAAQVPPTYSVDRDPDSLIRDVWESQRRYITFIVQDLWDFVPKLYASVKGEEMPK
jgi:SIR2-like domain